MKYTCKVVQSASREITFEVEAESESQAETIAQKEAVSYGFRSAAQTTWETDYIEIDESAGIAKAEGGA